MSSKYCVSIKYFWPDWWENFLHHCNDIAEINDWNVNDVINYQLKPDGKYIPSSDQGAYLQWDDEKYFTAFLLRWA